MARKSRWQQFADSFNSVYGTFNKAFEDIETSKLMKQEFKDDAGNALAGDDLDRARYRALADIKTKYGDAAGGLALRSNAAALESTTFANDLNRELRPELLAQRGDLQSGLMRAQINSADAGAANNYANANATNVMLPGRVVEQGLTNRGLGYDVDYKDRTIDYRVDQANAAARQATADADLAAGTVDPKIDSAEATARKDKAEADNAELTAAETLATTNERVAATLAELQAAATEAGNRVTSAEASARDNSVISDIFRESTTMDFGTTEAANAWLIEQFASADISPQARLSAAQTVNQFGAEVIGSRAAEITQNMRAAWQKGGLPGLADAYEKIADGIDARVERDGDTVRVIVDRGDGLPEILDEATGSDAETVLGARLMARMDDPMTAMQLAAQEASLAQTQAETDRTRAQTGLIDAQEFTTMLEANGQDARNALVQAQVEKINEDIRTSRAGLSDAKKIALRGLTDMLTDPNFIALKADDPELANQAQLDYMQTFGLVTPARDAPPPGIDQSTWDAMSEEERKLFP
jgi:hypothetical protein